MLVAEIHNKLPNAERTEDVLTSNVFGVMQYLPVQNGLIPFMEQAINMDRERLGELPRWKTAFDKTRKAIYLFWPRMKDRSEPDVAILLMGSEQDDDDILAVLMIEAKLDSGKGDRTDSIQTEQVERINGIPRAADELTNEWFRLIDGGNWRGYRIAHGLTEDKVPLKALVYVTAHSALPTEDIAQAMQSPHFPEKYYEEYHANSARPLFFWLPWASAHAALEDMQDSELDSGRMAMAGDLCLLLKRKGYCRFLGFEEILAQLTIAAKWRLLRTQAFQEERLFEHARIPNACSMLWETWLKQEVILQENN